MRKEKRPHYSEFMTKHKPKVPKSICTSLFNINMGIISPSLHLHVLLGGKGEAAKEELENYELLLKKYLCYKRKLSKSQWKNLYRTYREKNRIPCRGILLRTIAQSAWFTGLLIAFWK